MSLFTYRDFCCDEPLAISSPLGSSENISSVETLHTASPNEDPNDEETHESLKQTSAAGTLPVESGWNSFHPRHDPLDLAVGPSASRPGCSGWATRSTPASERHRLNDTILSVSSDESSHSERQVEAQFLPPRPVSEPPPPSPPPPPPSPPLQPETSSPSLAPLALRPPPRPPVPKSTRSPQLPAPPRNWTPQSPPTPEQPPSTPTPPPPPPSPPPPRLSGSPPPTPHPDFVNSLITVSVETLWRVSSAGGKPWCWLPPVSAAPSEQLTACRAVVPLRRLRHSELRRWLGPKQRCRSPVRLAKSTRLPSMAEARAPAGRNRSSSAVTESSVVVNGTSVARRRSASSITELPTDRTPKARGRPRAAKSLSPAVVGRAPVFTTDRPADGSAKLTTLSPKVTARSPAVRKLSSDSRTLSPVAGDTAQKTKGSSESAGTLPPALMGHASTAKNGSMEYTPQLPGDRTALAGRLKDTKTPASMTTGRAVATKRVSSSTYSPGKLSLSVACCNLSVVSREAAKAAARAVLGASRRHRHRSGDSSSSDSRRRKRSPTSSSGGRDGKMSRSASIEEAGGGQQAAGPEAETFSQRPSYSSATPAPGQNLSSTGVPVAATAETAAAKAKPKEVTLKMAKRNIMPQLTLISLFDPPDRRLSSGRVGGHPPVSRPTASTSSSPPLVAKSQSFSASAAGRQIQLSQKRLECRPASEAGSTGGHGRSGGPPPSAHARRHSAEKRTDVGGEAAGCDRQGNSHTSREMHGHVRPSTSPRKELVVPKKMLKLR